jgi:DNA-binding transcriptional LysR family regulator
MQVTGRLLQWRVAVPQRLNHCYGAGINENERRCLDIMDPGRSMHLRQLRYFVAAAEVGNFGRVADRMNITRPAFSRQIHDLEIELGVQLFERVGRRIRLSRAGKLYAQRTKDILDAFDRANEEVRSVSRNTGQSIRIGLLDFAGLQERVIDALRTLRTLFPSSEVVLKPMGSVDQIKALEVGTLDAGFVYNWPASSPHLANTNVAMDEWALAISPQHSLADSPTIRLIDLRHENFVSITRGVAPELYDQLMGGCRAGGLVPRIAQDTQSINSLFALVATSLSVGFVVRLAQPPRGIIVRSVADLSVQVPLDFVWRRDETRPDLLTIISAISASFRPREDE